MIVYNLPPMKSPFSLTPAVPSSLPSQPERIKKLLDNMEVSGKGAIVDKVEGMKYILAVRIKVETETVMRR